MESNLSDQDQPLMHLKARGGDRRAASKPEPPESPASMPPPPVKDGLRRTRGRRANDRDLGA